MEYDGAATAATPRRVKTKSGPLMGLADRAPAATAVAPAVAAAAPAVPVATPSTGSTAGTALGKKDDDDDEEDDLAWFLVFPGDTGAAVGPVAALPNHARVMGKYAVAAGHSGVPQMFMKIEKSNMDAMAGNVWEVIDKLTSTSSSKSVEKGKGKRSGAGAARAAMSSDEDDEVRVADGGGKDSPAELGDCGPLRRKW